MDLIVLWLLAALLSFSSGSAPGPAEDVEPAEPALSEVQWQFMQRDPLPSCGGYDLGLGSITDAGAGWDCLREAADGEGAELEITVSTVEGDPIRHYYRVTPDGLMEVYVDTTDDGFGPQGWTFESCSVEDASFRQGCP